MFVVVGIVPVIGNAIAVGIVVGIFQFCQFRCHVEIHVGMPVRPCFQRFSVDVADVHGMHVSGLLVGHNESTDAGKAAEQGHQHRQIVLPVFRLIVDLPDGELLAGSQPQCDQQHQQEPPCGKGKRNCRIGDAAVQSDRGIDVFELELQHVNFFIGLHGKLQRVIAAGRLCLCSLFESLCQVVVFHGEGNLIHLVLAVRMQPDTVQLVPV